MKVKELAEYLLSLPEHIQALPICSRDVEAEWFEICRYDIGHTSGQYTNADQDYTDGEFLRLWP